MKRPASKQLKIADTVKKEKDESDVEEKVSQKNEEAEIEEGGESEMTKTTRFDTFQSPLIPTDTFQSAYHL